MRIAILGATSQIAKDLILSFSADSSHELTLFARRLEAVSDWLKCNGLLEERYKVLHYDSFTFSQKFDAIINFIGAGDPSKAVAMGASILEVTSRYDDLAVQYLRINPECRYIFLSSGAAYGHVFNGPANENTKALVPLNNFQSQDWYSIAKLYAECRHRSLAPLPILDIRVFNYFSHTQDLDAKFLITDIVRCVQNNTVLKTSSENIIRDYLSSADFYQLIRLLLNSNSENDVVDCYSQAPIDKFTLLENAKKTFGLEYQLTEPGVGVNATGSKEKYYSLNKRAEHHGYYPTLCSWGNIRSELNSLQGTNCTINLPEYK